jgi:hypothetical protein
VGEAAWQYERAGIVTVSEQGLGMHNDRQKNVSLAINAIIRGLEFDQIAFRYDEAALNDAPGQSGLRHVETDEARGPGALPEWF